MLRNFLGGLLRGLGSYSPLTTWLMVVVAAGLILVLLPRSGTIAALSIYPGIENIDDYPYAYVRAVEEGVVPVEPVVYVLGASTMREALDSEKALTDAIERGVNEPVRVVDLTTPAQPMWLGDEIGTAAICGDRRGVLFLAVNFARARVYSPTDKRRWLVWPGLGPNDPVAEVKGRAELINSVLSGGLAEEPGRLWQAIARAPVSPATPRYSREYGRHRFMGAISSAAKAQRSVRSFWERIKLTEPATVDAFFADVGNFIRRIRSCSGIDVVLVDTPVNPLAFSDPDARAALAAYDQRASAFATQMGVRYVSLPTSVAFSQDDFYDYAHLAKRTAMNRVTMYLAGVAVELLSHRPSAP